MDHNLAVATKASERYLLNEMSEPERFDFESHYFCCEECAEDVRSGEILARGIKAGAGHAPRNSNPEQKPAGGWRKWFSIPALVPSAAAIAVTVMAGYQTLVVIPALQKTVQPQAVETSVLRAVSRGEEPSILVERKDGVSILMLDVNAGETGQPVAWELRPPGGDRTYSGIDKIPPAGAQFAISLANTYLRQAGVWTLTLRTPQGAETGRYPFRVETK